MKATVNLELPMETARYLLRILSLMLEEMEPTADNLGQRLELRSMVVKLRKVLS